MVRNYHRGFADEKRPGGAIGVQLHEISSCRQWDMEEGREIRYGAGNMMRLFPRRLAGLG